MLHQIPKGNLFGGFQSYPMVNGHELIKGNHGN